jgi:3-oxoacid CoA-transferase
MPLRQRTEAAHTVIVEAEEIVEVGEIPPEQVHLPGLYVNRLFKGSKYEHKIEILKFAHEDSAKKIPETSKRPRIHVN